MSALEARLLRLSAIQIHLYFTYFNMVLYCIVFVRQYQQQKDEHSKNTQLGKTTRQKLRLLKPTNIKIINNKKQQSAIISTTGRV